MRLVLLVALAMLAFGANSILTRMALAGGAADPASFAMIRVLSGALMLSLLVVMRAGGAGLALARPQSLGGTVALAVYMLGFSFAYVQLDAGTGALILFGAVQVAMFCSAALSGENLPWQKWSGALLAFGGLCYLLWPSAQIVLPLGSAFLMLAAALGWACFSIVGRSSTDPLADTARHFVWATPLTVLALAAGWSWPSAAGFGLAVLSGAVTSGLGYALWYRVLPQISASSAAVAQLSVPVIAVTGGVLLLGEALSFKLLVAAVLVLGGIALSLYRKSSSSGS